MKLKDITIQEVDHDFWLKGRLFSGRRNQREYSYPDRRIAYGLIIDPLEYRNFVEAFEDIKPDDEWADVLLVEYAENGDKKYEKYSGRRLNSIIRGEIPSERNKLMEILEQAEKISIGIRPQNNHRTTDHFYLRKNCSSVYSTTIRIKPDQLDKFYCWGFHDNRIFFVKADFYPDFEITR